MKLLTWNYLIMLFLLLQANACRQQQYATGDPMASAISSNLPYEVKEIRKTDGDCQAAEAPCVIMGIVYPVVSTGSPAAQQKINDSIESLVAHKIQRYTSEEVVPSQNLDSMAEAFVGRFNQMLADFPDYKQRWSYNLEGSIAYDSLDVITIEFNLYSFTGGAHPNAEVTYKSYDAQSGEKLQLSDIVADVEKVTELAEQKFRQQKQLAADADLNKAGYTFDQNQFALNENFGVLEKGIIFYYNDYEIAPYALGPTEILLTYEEVGDLLKI